MYEEIKPLQQRQLEILKELKRVCEKNNITYFLAYGSLIGAVRHHGFIPWDDDIDVCMNYPDYVRFENVCKRDLLPGFFLQSKNTEPNTGVDYMKLRMDNTTFILDKTVDKDIHQGINIDIYPIYNVADGKFARKIQLVNAAVYMLLEVGEAPRNHGGLMSIGSSVLLTVFRGKFRQIVKEYCYRQMAQYEGVRTKRKALMFGNMKICRQTYPAEYFEEAVVLPFEDDNFTAPGGYDGFLTSYYGDYMMLPPIDERGVKLEHIMKIDTENSYKKYKGILYCVNRWGVDTSIVVSRSLIICYDLSYTDAVGRVYGLA